ncbi:MAG: BrnT family toxin [Cellvibrionales bacterium]|jgi:uncharacterized DUF497 family protein|nr:BrnT family toxin [Cellvibrionales bacterium]MBK8675587.1 BrnT family toxin [Cellvibrionales bacterium]
MEMTFDAAKDASNLAKHGVALTDALAFEWDTAICIPDTRQNYGEPRVLAIGYIGLRLHTVVFVDREGVRRIISLRKANNREAKRYAKA